MPAPEQILESARTIANDAFALAVFWHAFVAVGMIVVSHGRATEHRVGEMLGLLPASVSGVAFAFGNPFNGAIFAVLALLLAASSRGIPHTRVQAGSLAGVVAGLFMMALGWAYPEFASRPFGWLYGSPLGLLPCPTLAFLIGVSLFFGGLGSRAWDLVLAAAGLFYGVYGAVGLGVRIDMLLAAGALVLGVTAALPATPRHRTAH